MAVECLVWRLYILCWKVDFAAEKFSIGVLTQSTEHHSFCCLQIMISIIIAWKLFENGYDCNDNHDDEFNCLSLWKACFLRRPRCKECPTHVPGVKTKQLGLFEDWKLNFALISFLYTLVCNIKHSRAQLKICHPYHSANQPRWSSNFQWSRFSSEIEGRWWLP